MKSLPDDKIPLPDTPGEAYYRTQRLHQNPPQDKAPVHFSNIPEPQREAFVQFWNSEDNAGGTGKVKVPLGRREVTFIYLLRKIYVAPFMFTFEFELFRAVIFSSCNSGPEEDWWNKLKYWPTEIGLCLNVSPAGSLVYLALFV